MANCDCLLWVGGNYTTIGKYVREARERGCCRKVSTWPPWLVPGESRAFLCHHDGFSRPDKGVIFGYYRVAGVDIVMGDRRWAEYQLLKSRLYGMEDDKAARGDLENFWRKAVPSTAIRTAAGAPERQPVTERTGGRGASRDPVVDDLTDFIIDVIWNCDDDPTLPHGRAIPTLLTGLESERWCGLRPKEDLSEPERADKLAFYLVDDLTRTVDASLCELIKELVKELIKRREPRRRPATGETRRGSAPPSAEEIAAFLTETGRELRGQIRPNGEKHTTTFEMAAEKALQSRDVWGTIDESVAGHAHLEGPLVVFNEPVPIFYRSPSAAFHGFYRIDGDTLLREIAATYLPEADRKVAIPYVFGERPNGGSGRSSQRVLIAALAQRCQTNWQLASNLLAALAEVVGEELGHRPEVRIADLGTFRKVWRVARKGRDPRTGVEIAIPARWTIGFRPAQGLRAHIGVPGAEPSVPTRDGEDL